MNYVIIFFAMVFSLMTWSSEAERDTTAKSLTEGVNFKEEMVVVDSLWNVIQRINNEWELIRYEGDIGIDYGDSVMVKRK